MKYFNKAKSLEEAKSTYKKLAMENHPDKGGETQVMQQINQEFEMIFQILKHSAKTETTETATSYRNEFYTANGWKGERYNIYLTTAEITKNIREYLKAVYPTFKFRVWKTSYSSLNVALMEAPVDIFANIETLEIDHMRNVEYFKKAMLKKHIQYHGETNALTEYGNKIMMEARSFVNSYNRDDSDSQSDYFDRRFYENLSVGTWDKPFQVVEKTARISPTKDSGKKRIA